MPHSRSLHSHARHWQDDDPTKEPFLQAPEGGFHPSKKTEESLHKLENGLASNLYVDSTNRRIAGGVVIVLSIIGFILMAVKADSNGICPASLSAALCFGIYAFLGLLLLLGLFIACGILGLLSGVYCCELCAQCGQMFACCLMATGEM